MLNLGASLVAAAFGDPAVVLVMPTICAIIDNLFRSKNRP